MSGHHITKRRGPGEVGWSRRKSRTRQRSNRLHGLAEAEVGAAQVSGRASRLLVVNLTTALAGPWLILQIRILRQKTQAHSDTHSKKSGKYGLDRARTQKAVRLKIHKIRWKPTKDHLDKLLVEDVVATRWDWVLHRRRQGAQLECGRGRSCGNCTLRWTGL